MITAHTHKKSSGSTPVTQCHDITSLNSGQNLTITYTDASNNAQTFTLAPNATISLCALTGSVTVPGEINKTYTMQIGSACDFNRECEAYGTLYLTADENNGAYSHVGAGGIRATYQVYSLDIQNLSLENSTSLIGKQIFKNNSTHATFDGSVYTNTPGYYGLSAVWNSNTYDWTVSINKNGYITGAAQYTVATTPTPTPTPTPSSSSDRFGGGGPVLVTPTPTPTPSSSSAATTTYKYVVECVSGLCQQGTGRVASSSTQWASESEVTLNNMSGCWQVLYATSASAASAITGACSPTVTPTPSSSAPATMYKYIMNPCDGISANFTARSNSPKTIGNVYACTGSAYVEDNYTVIATSTNAWVTWIGDSAVCEGGGLGCLLSGTQIEMHDGTLKNIEDIVIGDAVMSRSIATAPDSDNKEQLLEWSHVDPKIGTDLAQVTDKMAYWKTEIYNINSGLLRSSATHVHFIKRGDSYRFIEAKSIQVGDFLIDKANDLVEITSVVKTHGNYQVWKLDVESLDTYIANGIVTHNDKRP